MTKPRSSLVSLSDTPYYHCISRCVRRAFLCGEDSYSGQSYDHRRDWVVERLQTLSDIFAVDICAYAIMSNHYHLVLHVDRERAQTWSADEVIERWCRLFKGPDIVQRYRAGEILVGRDQAQLSIIVDTWRQRLHDISWYMRCLNEHIARRANSEDKCTGHFWESRFKCQALLDETALITAMAYVDLNPIRAGTAESLADSDKTSAQQRLQESMAPDQPNNEAVLLYPFRGVHNDELAGLPFNFRDYLDLVDWTGRCVRDDNHGSISSNQPRLLSRLAINEFEWLPNVTQMQARFELVMGSPQRMRAMARAHGGKYYRGYRYAAQLYNRLNLT